MLTAWTTKTSTIHTILAICGHLVEAVKLCVIEISMRQLDLICVIDSNYASILLASSGYNWFFVDITYEFRCFSNKTVEY